MKKIIYLITTLLCISSCQKSNNNSWYLLIGESDIWKYLTVEDEPPLEWIELDYDDQNWPEGKGGFGYGDDDDYTIVDSVSSLYLRGYFNLTNPQTINQLLLNADYDDAFIAYINGKEVARSNIGYYNNRAAYDDKARHPHEANIYQGGVPEYFEIYNKEILIPGKNVIAIQILNTNKKSSDLSARFFLSELNETSSTNGRTQHPDWFIPPVNLIKSSLPIVDINTNNQAILNDPRIIANISISNPRYTNHQNKSDSVSFSSSISLEIRGSSSQKRFLKKSFGFELQNKNGSNRNYALMEMPKENDWILYGPYCDKSLIRNVLLFDLVRQMGNYAPRTKFCELKINQEYQGLYVLMEKIKQDSLRVKIPKYKKNKKLNGYILKIDKKTGAGGEGWYSKFENTKSNSKNVFFQYSYPKASKLTNEHKTQIQTEIDNFEKRLNGEHFIDKNLGYRPLVNVSSFIDFFIANELSHNVDAYRQSTFFFRDEGGLINAGPVWDFNLSFGNGYDCNKQNSIGFMYDYNTRCEGKRPIPFWWQRLLEDPWFVDQLLNRWKYLRKNILSEENIFQTIDNHTAQIEEAKNRNFGKWKIEKQKVWPNLVHTKSHEEEIEFLKNWTISRLNWLDDEIPKLMKTAQD